MKGKITRWHDDKGYGFITAPDGKSKIFVHVSAMKSRSKRLAKNDTVLFDIEQDSKGRLNAVNVELTGLKALSLTTLFGGTFLVFVYGATLLLGGSVLFIPLYLVMSILTYKAYASDKRAAEHGNWRTPESQLHAMALAGGWPGALLAQSQLRHKSKKQPFKTILWLTIFINIAGFIWTLSQPGHEVISRLTHLIL